MPKRFVLFFGFVVMITLALCSTGNTAEFQRIAGDGPIFVVEPRCSDDADDSSKINLTRADGDGIIFVRDPRCPTKSNDPVENDPTPVGFVKGIAKTSVDGRPLSYCFVQLTKQDPVTGWRNTAGYGNCDPATGEFLVGVSPDEYTMETFSADHALDRRTVTVIPAYTYDVGTVTLTHHLTGFQLIASYRDNILKWDIFKGTGFPSPKKFHVTGTVFAPGRNWLGINVPVRQTASVPGPEFANKITLPADILPGSTVCVTVELTPNGDPLTILTTGHGLCFQAGSYAVGSVAW